MTTGSYQQHVLLRDIVLERASTKVLSFGLLDILLSRNPAVDLANMFFL